MKRQKGGVLIFVLIFLGALCLLMAYVMDLNSYYVRKTQADANAKIVALSALEEYYKSFQDCPLGQCTKAQRFERALNRAKQVGDRNLMLADASQQTSQLAPDGNQNGAILTPGKWERNVSVCQSQQEPMTAPCFIPLAYPLDESKKNEHPNAFKVEGTLYPEGSKTFFADTFMGIKSLAIHVDTISSLVPRKGCFLVDISASTVADTHKPYEMYGGCPIKNANGTIVDVQYPCCPNLSMAGNMGYEYAEFAYNIQAPYTPGVTFTPKSIIDDAWQCMLLSPFRTTDPANTRHYKNDYFAQNLLLDSSYSLDDVYEKYHPNPNPQAGSPDDALFGSYDFHVKRSPVYWVDRKSKPEPLRTIFEGIRAAIEAFKVRAVAGDDLCLVFFDQHLSWPRIVKLTTGEDPQAKIEYLETLTDFSDTVQPGGETGMDRIIKHGMFPDYYSDTNIQQALYYVQTQFNQVGDVNNGGTPSSNFIVLISDGLGNCRKCTATELAPGGDCTNKTTNEVVKEYVCSPNNFNDHYNAIQEVKEIAFGANGLATQKIPLHVILVGDNVKPNTMRIHNPNNPGQCYSDAEYRDKERLPGEDPYNFVYNGIPPGTWELLGKYQQFENKKTAPYYAINRDFYQMAVATRGIWGPIRPPCKTPPPACSAGQAPQILDCDPEGDSTSAQIKEYFKEIVSFNPYAIVYSK